MNLSSINRRMSLLEGICRDAIARLQDKQFTPDLTRVLRSMKAARQVEAVELMVASNTITVAHADARSRPRLQSSEPTSNPPSVTSNWPPLSRSSNWKRK